MKITMDEQRVKLRKSAVSEMQNLPLQRLQKQEDNRCSIKSPFADSPTRRIASWEIIHVKGYLPSHPETL